MLLSPLCSALSAVRPIWAIDRDGRRSDPVAAIRQTADFPRRSPFCESKRVGALQGKGFLKGKTVGFSLERSSFGTFLST